MGIHPDDIWNADESGFRIGVGKNQIVYTLDPKKRHYLPSDTERKSVTIIEAISAGGEVAPPFIILPGAIHQSRWYEYTDLHDDTTIGVSETGFSNDILGFQWMVAFHRRTVKRTKGTWRLLICDAYGSHCTKEVLAFAIAHRIRIFHLPAHTSHFLQPLDKTVFQPFKHWHGMAVNEAARTGCDKFSVMEFLAALNNIRASTFKDTTIRAAFRETEIVPLNAQIPIDVIKCRGWDARPSTPTGPPEVTIPETLQELRVLISGLRSGEISPSKTNQWMFYEAAARLTVKGDLASDALETTQAATKARDRRNDAPRRQLAKGGVLKVSKARSIAWAKKPVAEKARQQVLKRYPHFDLYMGTWTYERHRSAIELQAPDDLVEVEGKGRSRRCNVTDDPEMYVNPPIIKDKGTLKACEKPRDVEVSGTLSRQPLVASDGRSIRSS